MVSDLLKGYPVVVEIAVAWGEMDSFQHVNNVVYFRYFESARIAYITTVIPSHRPTEPEDDWGLIFAECHINYRAPAFYEEAIRTWLRPGDVARSSFRIHFEMNAEGDGRLLAEGYGVLVGYDYAAGRATALTDDVRAVLSSAR